MTLLDADVKPDPLLGEDTWELFEVIEDSFGVDLGDYSAVCGMTVSELAEVVSKKANYPAAEKCLSAVAFYRLRRAFGTLFGIPRATIRPATCVSNLLPGKLRRARWMMLQEHLGLTFPALRFPGWALWLSLVSPPALLISLRLFMGLRLSAGWIVGGSSVLILLTFARIIPAVDARIPLARIIPEECETFSGLVKVVLARNYAAFASQGAGSCEGDVLKALRQLAATQLGMGFEKISPEARIPQDLDIY
jgi:hypothetical protein